MRLWSLHPRYLDAKGLVALWREALLAQKVLQGKTKGYRHHPQLLRFKECADPLRVIGAYLTSVYDEAVRRGYTFDETKILYPDKGRYLKSIEVTRGQRNFESQHLKKKLTQRSPKFFKKMKSQSIFRLHPLFTLVSGSVASWEIR